MVAEWGAPWAAAAARKRRGRDAGLAATTLAAATGLVATALATAAGLAAVACFIAGAGGGAGDGALAAAAGWAAVACCIAGAGGGAGEGAKMVVEIEAGEEDSLGGGETDGRPPGDGRCRTGTDIPAGVTYACGTRPRSRVRWCCAMLQPLGSMALGSISRYSPEMHESSLSSAA